MDATCTSTLLRLLQVVSTCRAELNSFKSPLKTCLKVSSFEMAFAVYHYSLGSPVLRLAVSFV